MIYLILIVTSSVVIQQLLRYALSGRRQLPLIISSNYFTAMCIFLIILIGNKNLVVSTLETPILISGVINGLLFITTMIIMTKSFRYSGVGIASAAYSMGVPLTVLIAWLLWQERISTLQVLTVCLIPLGLFLMQPERQEEQSADRQGTTLLVINLFLATIQMLIHKSASMNTNNSSSLSYYTLLFLSASVASVIYLYRTGFSLQFSDLILGVAIGIFNAVNAGFLLPALRTLPTAVVLLSAQCGTVVINLLLDHFLWHHRFVFRQVFGVSVTVGLVLLAIIS